MLLWHEAIGSLLQAANWLGIALDRGLLVDERHDDGRDLEGLVPLSEAERRHGEDRLPIFMTKKVVRAAQGMSRRAAHGGHDGRR